MIEYTVIAKTGVTPRKDEQTFYCDPRPPVYAASPQEAVQIALEAQEAEWNATGRPGSTGTFQFAVLGKTNRGFIGVTIVNATVEVATVRVSEVEIACSEG